MVLIDIIMFFVFAGLIFFGYDFIKYGLKRFLPSKYKFNEDMRKFSTVADEDRITPEMVGLAAIAQGRPGVYP